MTVYLSVDSKGGSGSSQPAKPAKATKQASTKKDTGGKSPVRFQGFELSGGVGNGWSKTTAVEGSSFRVSPGAKVSANFGRLHIDGHYFFDLGAPTGRYNYGCDQPKDVEVKGNELLLRQNSHRIAVGPSYIFKKFGNVDIRAGFMTGIDITTRSKIYNTQYINQQGCEVWESSKETSINPMMGVSADVVFKIGSSKSKFSGLASMGIKYSQTFGSINIPSVMFTIAGGIDYNSSNK